MSLFSRVALRALAAAFSLSVLPIAWAEEAALPEVPTVAAAKTVPIPGFRAVTADAVYRGGRPNERGLRWLADHGFRSVVNLQGRSLPLIPGESENMIRESRTTAESMGLRYYHLPVYVSKRIDAEEAKLILRAVRVMTDRSLRPVYVHCNVGADRTGIVIAAFRILGQGCGYEQAKNEMMATGLFWTPLLEGARLRFLKSLAAYRAEYGFARAPESCPL